MSKQQRAFFSAILCGVIIGISPAGWGKPAHPLVQAAMPAPGIAELKAIAEEGFIYGLPIVMNYAVMFDYVVDKNSGQFKAPFNQIHNEARVFTYKDTAIVTPTATRPTPCCGWTCERSRWCFQYRPSIRNATTPCS